MPYCTVVFLISGICVNTFLRKITLKKIIMIAQLNCCSHNPFKGKVKPSDDNNNRIQTHSCCAHRFRTNVVLHSPRVHSCASMLNICSE